MFRAHSDCEEGSVAACYVTLSERPACSWQRRERDLPKRCVNWTTMCV